MDEPSPDQIFELSGGALCLDFANTCSRFDGPRERLRTYGDLVAFAKQTGILDADEAAAVAALATADPSGADRELAAAKDLREALYRLLSAVAAGDPPPEADLARLNERLPAALAGLRVAARDGAFAWVRHDVATSLAAPLHPIVRSAAELLASSDDLARVRECGDAHCAWLFLDRSRNRSRRWCSMESCGNRAKARRHYRRHRAVHE